VWELRVNGLDHELINFCIYGCDWGMVAFPIAFDTQGEFGFDDVSGTAS
jgi:hypothetical protein